MPYQGRALSDDKCLIAMAIHLRQICLIADRLPPAVKQLSEVLSIQVCHVDPAVGKFGLENAVLAAGTKFIEVVAPVQANTAVGRFLERRGGNGGYMIICQVPSLEEQAEVRARAVAKGVRLAFESDRNTWNIMQLHPADMGAAFLEVDWDEEADMNGNWAPAGGKDWRNTRCTDRVSDIVAAELQSDDPEALAKRWAAVLGLQLERCGEDINNGVPTIALANADLRFVQARDGRGPGLGGLDLRVWDRALVLSQAEACGASVSGDQVMLCGTRFNLLD